MAFDPLEWDALARELAARGDEGSLRAAIGRLYYAMFVKSREALVAKKYMVPSNTASDHREVVDLLTKHKRGTAGVSLGKLRQMRNTADYDHHTATTAQTYAAAEIHADTIKRLCQPDWQ